MVKPRNISVWASGNGSNAENIIHFFANSKDINVDHILCNKKEAGVFQRAEKLNVPAHYFNFNDFRESKSILNLLKAKSIHYIILAGFLLKVSSEIIQQYRGRILNIHPALLPAYGGKGMYGMNVHKAVIADKMKHSGISIHLVDEEYDHGKLIFQSICDIDQNETPESLAEKIHHLEHTNYPEVIENYILSFEN
ncbi:MAG: phosphoribosylglycinamide formyltransferase [Bacteroidales bacterium]|nr:phosphoribosylglycinamide formyltransferase [Bacteroidales bacterium]